MAGAASVQGEARQLTAVPLEFALVVDGCLGCRRLVAELRSNHCAFLVEVEEDMAQLLAELSRLRRRPTKGMRAQLEQMAAWVVETTLRIERLDLGLDVHGCSACRCELVP